MRLAKEVLIEIVDLVRQGLVTNTDISEKLRQLDLEVKADAENQGLPSLALTEEYLIKNPRGTEWVDEEVDQKEI
ncbi:MAG: hypothetical protein ACYDHY_07425 [Acidiferrobacterales bacterium]